MPHLRSRCYILCPFAIPLFPEKNCLTRIQNDPYMRFEFTIYIGGKQATKKLLIWCSEFFSPFPTWLCFQLTSNIFLKLYPFKQNYTYYVYNTYWVEREKKKRIFYLNCMFSRESQRKVFLNEISAKTNWQENVKKFVLYRSRKVYWQQISIF